MIQAIEHVQLAMPKGEEARAEAFYAGLLGLSLVPKPANLQGRGGCWFEHGSVKIHLGVEEDFRPAKKAHPALLTESLSALLRKLRKAGIEIVDDEPLEGFRRAYVSDPFGNRIELMERTAP